MALLQVFRLLKIILCACAIQTRLGLFTVANESATCAGVRADDSRCHEDNFLPDVSTVDTYATDWGYIQYQCRLSSGTASNARILTEARS